ncbi:hypothetical protein TELCIR_12785 [Teladorsagia circumcincta]|uniref:SCP domain-containing protein n=1 Tax=Teladorsagia circumcincta TaxID=45464 RepID=A0A2G9U5U0_TELCI|nr:hypothetical protein TELCIR_12785 [Teladorsagia circumcincta]
MFWDRTYSVGCGVIVCDDGQTSVVCHYYPQGNWRGQKWYTAGETLSECGMPRKPNIPDDAPENFVPLGEFDPETRKRREKLAAMEVSHLDTGLCEISDQEIY